jgi:uncharacterized protein YdiU (UPF0061 family)
MTAQTEAVELLAFDNSYACLPDRFFARLLPTPVAAPRLVKLNDDLARHLGLDPGKLATPEGVEILAGKRVPKSGEPLAMAYAVHQFGAFVPQLGDGRAILLGEVIDRDGVRRDIQFFAARGDVDAIRRLADHVIARHYPEAVDAANPYRTLLDLVISRQAELVAKWLHVGFIHGVMNTDNMSIAGSHARRNAQ